MEQFDEDTCKQATHTLFTSAARIVFMFVKTVVFAKPFKGA